MNFSLYSLLMAILWSSAFILLLFICRRNSKLLLRLGTVPFLLLIAGSVLRCFLPMEFPPFTKVISNRGLLFADVNLFLKEPIGGTSVSPLLLFVIVWITVFLILLIRFFVGYLCYMKKINSYEEIDDLIIVKISEKIAGILKIRCPQIYQTSGTQIPLIIGFFKPRLILPTYAYSETDYEYICAHELSHWKNGDLWVKLLLEVFSDFFWWNPMVFLLKRALAQTLEIKCDLSVIGNKPLDERSAYLETIKKTIRYSPTNEEKTVLPYTVSEFSTTDKNELIQRTDIILNYKTNPAVARSTITAAAGTMLALFILSYAFIIQPSYDPPEITEGGNVEFTPETTYLIKKEDGSFWLYIDGKGGIIDSDLAMMMLEDGFALKDMEE